MQNNFNHLSYKALLDYKIFMDANRFVLRNVNFDDIDKIVEYVSDYRVASMMNGSIPSKYKREQAREWVIKHLNDCASSQAISWIIANKQNNQLIGSIQLLKDKDEAYLSYWIGYPFWNQGYATEAVSLVLKYGFLKIGYKKIKAEHLEKNFASRSVLKKLGFQFDGDIQKLDRSNKEIKNYKKYFLCSNKYK